MENETLSRDSEEIQGRDSVFPVWQSLLLLALMVTVFGLTSQTRLQKLPRAFARDTAQFERDPYDIRPERSISDARSVVVETGL